jgi:hypothetical protein
LIATAMCSFRPRERCPLEEISGRGPNLGIGTKSSFVRRCGCF